MFNLQNITLIQIINTILTITFFYLIIKGMIILKRSNKTIYNSYVANYKLKRIGYILYTLSLIQIIHYILFYNSPMSMILTFYPIFFAIGPVLFNVLNEMVVKKNLSNIMRVIFIIYILIILVINIGLNA